MNFLSSQFHFGHGKCLCCQEESSSSAEESCQRLRSSNLTSYPAPLGFTENLALPGGEYRAWRLGNVELNLRAPSWILALEVVIVWLRNTLRSCISPGFVSSMYPGLPVSTGTALPLLLCLCLCSPVPFSFCRCGNQTSFKVTWLVSGRAGIRTQFSMTQKPELLATQLCYLPNFGVSHSTCCHIIS